MEGTHLQDYALTQEDLLACIRDDDSAIVLIDRLAQQVKSFYHFFIYELVNAGFLLNRSLENSGLLTDCFVRDVVGRNGIIIVRRRLEVRNIDL